MKKFFTLVCAFTTIFSTLAIMLGMCVGAQIQTFPGYVIAFIASLIVIALMLMTREIARNTDAFHRCARIFWCLALLANVAAVILALSNHLILQRPLGDSTNLDWKSVRDSAPLQLATVTIIGIFLSAAPVASSFLGLHILGNEPEDEEGARASSLSGGSNKIPA